MSASSTSSGSAGTATRGRSTSPRSSPGTRPRSRTREPALGARACSPPLGRVDLRLLRLGRRKRPPQARPDARRRRRRHDRLRRHEPGHLSRELEGALPRLRPDEARGEPGAADRLPLPVRRPAQGRPGALGRPLQPRPLPRPLVPLGGQAADPRRPGHARRGHRAGPAQLAGRADAGPHPRPDVHRRTGRSTPSAPRAPPGRARDSAVTLSLYRRGPGRERRGLAAVREGRRTTPG